MKKAIVIDMDYGSVTHEDLYELKSKLEAQDIALSLTHCTDEDQIIDVAGDAAVVIATGNPPITEKVLSSLPGLEAVIRLGIGVNSVDLDAATKYGKVIMNMPGFCINELAVHATALALALDRNVVYYDRGIRAGTWPKATYYIPRAPKDMTLGLYGFGGSARELYRIFRMGFGSRVITCDPYVPEEARKQYDVEFVDFETLLAQSDILSIHAPLNKETYHIFGAEAFRKMKNDAAIINIARGGLIDQEALADALDAGEIRFAGLDVFEQEPIPVNSRLLEHDDVVLTCHSAFYGEESKARQLQWAYELTVSALNEKKLDRRKVANPAVIEKASKFNKQEKEKYMGNTGYRIINEWQRPGKELVELFRGIPVANIDDCMNRTAAVDGHIRPVNKAPLLGTAFTVKVAEGDNLMFHKAMDMAQPGDVIVIDAGGYEGRAIFGGLMVSYCKVRGIAGVIVDGAVRDYEELSQMDISVYAKGVTPNGPYKNGPGQIGTTISFGGQVVRPGDIIVGDADGIIVIKPEEAQELAQKARAVVEKEAKILENILKHHSYERPWVDETLRATGCEL